MQGAGCLCVLGLLGVIEQVDRVIGLGPRLGHLFGAYTDLYSEIYILVTMTDYSCL